MNANTHNDDQIIDIWFRLRDAMLATGETAVGARPPSLRESCYAYALAMRTASIASPELVESFVNGLELGAISALRAAWEKNR